MTTSIWSCVNSKNIYQYQYGAITDTSTNAEVSVHLCMQVLLVCFTEFREGCRRLCALPCKVFKFFLPLLLSLINVWMSQRETLDPDISVTQSNQIKFFSFKKTSSYTPTLWHLCFPRSLSYILPLSGSLLSSSVCPQLCSSVWLCSLLWDGCLSVNSLLLWVNLWWGAWCHVFCCLTSPVMEFT